MFVSRPRLGLQTEQVIARTRLRRASVRVSFVAAAFPTLTAAGCRIMAGPFPIAIGNCGNEIDLALVDRFDVVGSSCEATHRWITLATSSRS
jgi:hypothetical protein